MYFHIFRVCRHRIFSGKKIKKSFASRISFFKFTEPFSDRGLCLEEKSKKEIRCEGKAEADRKKNGQGFRSGEGKDEGEGQDQNQAGQEKIRFFSFQETEEGQGGPLRILRKTDTGGTARNPAGHDDLCRMQSDATLF